MSKLVAYYRVSTERQGQSGLGLEAQRIAVGDFAKCLGSSIDAEYTEVESGRVVDRPELAKAIAHVRRLKGKLVIAKLDRLARNVAFVSALMESGADFVACDNPHANRLTIHILAAVAEDEGRRISQRTKDALAAAKARGVRLGSHRRNHWKGREELRLKGLAKGREIARRVRHQNAMAAVADLLPEIEQRRQKGQSLARIATALNEAGQRTTRGNLWTPMGIKLVLDRARSHK